MESIEYHTISFRPFLSLDKDKVLDVWKDGRETLRLSAIDQWQKGDYPGEKEFLADKESGEGIAVVKGSSIVAVFALSEEKEKDYEDPSLDWTDRDGRYLVIHRSAVKKEWRRNGIMGKIFSYACDIALERGCSSV
ncbi:MAG: GNAT family N-acetyltransferase, partial [Candidatus Ornithospirochaeta sp.]